MPKLTIAYLVKVLCLLSLGLAAFYCYQRPLYNWDMLAYTHLVLQMDHKSSHTAHDLTYAFAKRNIPEEDYYKLTDSTHEFRHRMEQSAEAFDQQLPFYVIKPLYLGLCYLSYKAGVPLPQATYFPSVFSYLLIGLLLFHWLSRYLRTEAAHLTGLLIMVSYPLLYIAKAASPDCLSCLLWLGIFYLILEKPMVLPIIILMSFSILARLDNIVTCMLVIGFLYFSKKWHPKLTLQVFLSAIACFGSINLLTGLLARNYGWSIFFYPDFMGRLQPHYGSLSRFRFGSYFRVMYEHFLSGLNHSYLALFLALLLLRLRFPVSLRKLSFDQAFCLLIPLILLVRFLLFPEIADRFYVPFYLVILTLLAKDFKTVTGVDKPEAGV